MLNPEPPAYDPFLVALGRTLRRAEWLAQKLSEPLRGRFLAALQPAFAALTSIGPWPWQDGPCDFYPDGRTAWDRRQERLRYQRRYPQARAWEAERKRRERAAQRRKRLYG
jgi:hypothetical protein